MRCRLECETSRPHTTATHAFPPDTRMGFPKPEEVDMSKLGFAPSINSCDNGQTRYWALSRTGDDFTKSGGPLYMQLCSAQKPLVSRFGLSMAPQGSRWNLDVQVPTDSKLFEVLESLNEKASRALMGNGKQAFPAYGNDVLTEDQMRLSWINTIKQIGTGNGNTAAIRIKIVVPAMEEELKKMTDEQRVKRERDTTEIIKIVNFVPSEGGTPAVCEYTKGDHSMLTPGCKVMPNVYTSGMWLNATQAGLTITCTSICVWEEPKTTGIEAFDMGEAVLVNHDNCADLKRKRAEEDPGVYEAYLPSS